MPGPDPDDHGGTVVARVLGPVALFDSDGHEVALAPQKREILAALAAASGAAVSREALVVAVWGDDTTATRHRLKSQIAQLRPLMARGLSIEHRNGGYRLCGPLDQLDSTRFEGLVSRHRELAPEAAAEVLTVALALWGGVVPFTNVDNELVDAATWRLLALRDEAVLALADLEIGRRRIGAALAHVERLFATDPMRGDVAARSAALFALAGRPMDGLRAIQRHRDAVAEVGAVIAPDLAELESAILRHEAPTTTAGPTPRADLPSASAAWLPRTRWIERLDAAIAAGAVVIVGEPGVGKTSLTRALEQLLTERGTTVVRAAAPADPVRPMDLVVAVVERLEATLPGALATVVRDGALAAAHHRLAAVSDPAGTPPPVITRDEFLADLATLIGATLDHAGAVLVVDDAHWLDGSSADVLAAVMARPGTRVAVTTRPSLPDALTRVDAPVIELDGFDEQEVDELLRQALPLRGNAELSRRLHRQTGGNPLFLGLAMEVMARGELGRDIPESVQHAVQERTVALSRSTVDVLQVAALLGHSFPLAALARVRPRADAALTAAVEERLVRVDRTAQLGHFVHGLVADALAAMVPTGARVALHDELCRALVAVGAPAVAVATHAVASAALDPVRAAHACRAAGAAQATVFEWDPCIEWARRGLDVVVAHGLHDECIEAELRALVGTALRRWSSPGSDTELLRAAEVAHACGADELFVRVVTELCLHGPTTQAGGVETRALQHLDRALTLHTGDATRAELCSAAATLLSTSDASPRARELYQEALALAVASGRQTTMRTVLMNAHLGLGHCDDVAPRRHAADELATFPDDEAQWEASFLRLGVGLVTADRALVEQAVAHLRQMTPAVRQRERASGLLQVETVHAFVCGRLDEADALSERALAASLEKYSPSWAMSIYATLIFPIREAQGRVTELTGAVDAMLADSPDFVTWHAVAAYVAARADDRDRVAHELAVLRAGGVALAADTTWTAIATMLAVPVHTAGDRVMAADLYQRLSPFAGQLTWNGLSTHGPVDMGLAHLAATLGDRTRADTHWARAQTVAGAFGAPHLLWPEPATATEA